MPSIAGRQPSLARGGWLGPFVGNERTEIERRGCIAGRIGEQDSAAGLRNVELRWKNSPMCNRYRLTHDMHAWAIAMGLEPLGEYDNLPAPEIFPRRRGWVVRNGENGRVAEAMVWGFPPPAQATGPVTNVRNLASPFWRSALADPARRCLVPANEFCEWQGEKGAKVARWFSVPSQPTFAFAGLWRPIEAGAAYAFLTCEPNAVVAPIHPKAMPVILHPEDHERWLAAPMAEAVALAAPFPSQLMAVA